MKRLISFIAATTLMLSAAAGLAEDTNALDAFNALTGQQVQISTDKTSAEYLADIMTGTYAARPADMNTAAKMAADLPYLTAVSTRDIAAYASANKQPVRQVRNAYYMALANVLRAEIMVNPASEERYKNVQVILSLFLNDEGADEDSRAAIRSSMTPDNAAVIAAEYSLPVGFVEFVIMDDDWDDDRWDNDDDWRDVTIWDDSPYDDSDDDLRLGDRDTATSTRIADMQELLIALGYLTGKADGVFGEQTQAALRQSQLANGYRATGWLDDDDFDDMIDDNVVARWDYDDSFDYVDSADYDNTPDNTPDYDNSIDRDNSPDPTKAPVRQNSLDNSPDNSPDNSSDYDNS